MPQKTYGPTFERLRNTQDTQVTVQRQTMHMPGLAQSPPAGPEGTPCLFTRISVPYEIEVVTWIASTDAGPPKPPSPYGKECDFGLNENRVLLDMKFGAIVPNPIGGGTAGHGWSMSGVYIYGKIQPEFGSGKMNDVPLGKLWYENHDVSANYIPKTNFLQDAIVDASFPKPIFPMPDAEQQRPGP